MIKAAIFAGDAQEAKQFIAESDYTANEVKYIRTYEDIEGLGDVEIIMYGTYYERGDWYTKLADKLEENVQYARQAEREEEPPVISKEETDEQQTETESATESSDEPDESGSSRTDTGGSQSRHH